MAEHDEEQEYDPLEEEAPYKPQRDALGRYLPDNSGNPRGKNFQLKRDPKLPASRRRVISDVADRMFSVTIDGVKRKMSLYEANVHTMAVAGAKGDRIAAKKFIELMLLLADRDLERRLMTRQMMEEMNAIVDENELLKKKFSPESGVIALGAEAFAKWSAERRLDDEEGVAEVLGDSLTKR